MFDVQQELNTALDYIKNKQTDAALDVIENIIKAAEFYINQKQHDKAEEAYLAVLSIIPDDLEVLFKLGVVKCMLGKVKEGIEFYKKALKINPNVAQINYNMGLALYREKNFQEAITYYQKAITLKPDFAEAFHNMGLVYTEIDPELAIPYYEKALSLRNDYACAYNNLGKAYLDNLETKKAIDYFLKAIEFEPSNIDYLNNLGNAYYLVRDFKNALKYLHKALDIKPDDQSVRFNLAGIKLINGEFEEGWALYESRFHINNGTKIQKFSKPLWTGQNPEGKTIFVCKEQGLGDNIQYSRYISELVKRGAKVIYQPNNLLYPLFKLNEQNIGAEILDLSVDHNTVEHDLYVPLMSLPHYLKACGNIPRPEGYLQADTEKTKYFKEKFFNTKKLKVGIFWQGNPKNKLMRERAIQLEKFKKLFSLEKIQFYSFQKGAGVEQLENFSESDKIINLDLELNNFVDTASALMNIDLLITIDTAIAHLSGALARSTLLLLPYSAGWCWLLDRKDTLWYSSVELFRQKLANTWEDVIEEIYIKLASF